MDGSFRVFSGSSTCGGGLVNNEHGKIVMVSIRELVLVMRCGLKFGLLRLRIKFAQQLNFTSAIF